MAFDKRNKHFLHTGHISIEKSKARSGKMLYWPGINSASKTLKVLRNTSE